MVIVLHKDKISRNTTRHEVLQLMDMGMAVTLRNITTGVNITTVNDAEALEHALQEIYGEEVWDENEIARLDTTAFA